MTAAAVLLWDRLLVEGRQNSPLFAEFAAATPTSTQALPSLAKPAAQATEPAQPVATGEYLFSAKKG